MLRLLPLPETDQATLSISAELVNATQSPQEGVLRGTIAETGLTFEQRVNLRPGETRLVVVSPPPMIDHPRLWWPVNYGPQKLYHLALTFESGGELSDRLELKDADSQLVWARAGANRNVQFNVKLSQPGRHHIRVGNQATSVLVTP